jgi:pimeloyl-ACP methyl ester carboxylesterase
VAIGEGEAFYFADHVNNRIRRIDSGGIITTIAGNGQNEPPRDGVVGTQSSVDLAGSRLMAATISGPELVAIVRAGHFPFSKEPEPFLRRVRGFIARVGARA